MEEAGVNKNGWLNEDWMSLILGMVIFVLSLGVFYNVDLLGWAAKNNVWMKIEKSVGPVSKAFTPLQGTIESIDGKKLNLKKTDGKTESVTVDNPADYKPGDLYKRSGVSGPMSIIFTYLAMLVLMGAGVAALGGDIKKFAAGFTIAFWISYACYVAGHYAYIAATKNQLKEFDLPWAMSLTGEIGFIIALVAGLLIGNFFPKLANFMNEAAKPELYIKTAIVIMGAGLGVKAAESLGLATSIMFRGFCAIVEAYLIYWATVYWVARRYFKFSREWSAPLASGISICGVSAAIATGGAIKARPIVPIMVSSLVVVFVAVEMILLPFIAKIWLWSEPLVAGAWMGLAVKSDGGAIASGAITDALIRAKTLDMTQVNYAEGWITMTATTVKMFIDIFIGIWSFLLAIVWCTKIENKPGQKVKAIEIWHRFPKFVIGYAFTFLVLIMICLPEAKKISPYQERMDTLKSNISGIEKLISAEKNEETKASLEAKVAPLKSELKDIQGKIKEPRGVLDKANLASGEGNAFRALFFLLCFFTIGLVSNFKKLMEEGIGKLAAVYVVCLFGFIIWVGLFISWLFFHGAKPPVLPI